MSRVLFSKIPQIHNFLKSPEGVPLFHFFKAAMWEQVEMSTVNRAACQSWFNIILGEVSILAHQILSLQSSACCLPLKASIMTVASECINSQELVLREVTIRSEFRRLSISGGGGL